MSSVRRRRQRRQHRRRRRWSWWLGLHPFHRRRQDRRAEGGAGYLVSDTETGQTGGTVRWCRPRRCWQRGRKVKAVVPVIRAVLAESVKSRPHRATWSSGQPTTGIGSIGATDGESGIQSGKVIAIRVTPGAGGPSGTATAVTAGRPRWRRAECRRWGQGRGQRHVSRRHWRFRHRRPKRRRTSEPNQCTGCEQLGHRRYCCRWQRHWYRQRRRQAD